MTLEKAIELKAAVGRLMYSNNKDVRDYNALIDFIESALRPVSREQVERVWRSYWDGSSNGYADGYEVFDEWQCRKCGFEVETDEIETLPRFCPVCGAPMTDEAVEMVMDRMEGMENG